MRVRLWIPPSIVLLTFAWLVGIFSQTTAPLQDLWRPLLIAGTFAVLLLTVTSLVTGGHRLIVLAVGCIWLWALGATVLVVLIGLVVLLRLAVSALRRIQRRAPIREPLADQVSRVTTAIGVGLAVVATIWAANAGALAEPFGRSLDPGGLTLAAEDGPNVYLVLLDGYPRADTLAEELGFDNRPFLDELRARGFEVAERSRTSYGSTLLTLNSMLHMGYVDEIDGLNGDPGTPASQARRLTASMQAAPALALLADAGYRIVAVPSIYSEAALMSADDVRSSGAMTHFDEQVLRFMPIGRWLIGLWPEWVPGEVRRDVEFGLDALVGIAEEAADGQIAAFVHLFSPHAPAVFEADGGPADAPDCYPRSCAFTVTEVDIAPGTFEVYAERLSGQIEHLNGRLLETVDAVIASDPTGVIILFADHGARYESGPSSEYFHTLFAARTPDRHEVFPADHVAVNTFPLLYDAYFDSDLPTREYRAWWGTSARPLELEPYEIQR